MPKERRQIAVYPDRFTLLWYAFLYLLGMGAIALCGYWVVTGTPPRSGTSLYGWVIALLGSLGLVGQIVGGGLAIFFMFGLAVVLICTLYRLIIRRPSVIVNSDGITDHCSLIAGGAGFIGWDEIAALWVTVRERHDLYHVTTVRRSHFVVLLHNEQAIVSRLHPLVREVSSRLHEETWSGRGYATVAAIRSGERISGGHSTSIWPDLERPQRVSSRISQTSATTIAPGAGVSPATPGCLPGGDLVG